MYDELFKAWKTEKETAVLQKLSENFYSALAYYIKNIREERRMLDEKSAKGRLLTREFKSVVALVRDLVWLRYYKTMKASLAGEPVLIQALTKEERQQYGDILPSETSKNFSKEILQGRLPDLRTEANKTKVIRLLRKIPAIVGADMKTYGPFEPEDIATVPSENARLLIKQGAAVEVMAK
jgi:DNA replication initiation complex subunit (GINS family)